MMVRYWVCLFVCLFIMPGVNAADLIIDDQFSSAKPLHFHYTQSDISIAEVVHLNRESWLTSADGALNLGLQDKTTWAHFSLNNLTGTKKQLYLLIAHPLIDSVTLFQSHHGEIRKFDSIGDREPLKNRQIKDEALIFSITLNAKASDQFFIKVNSEGNIKLPLSLWTPETLVQSKSKYNLITGLFLGFLLALVFSNALLFALTRKSRFLLGACYIASLWALLTVILGFSYRYFNFNNQWFQTINIALLFLSATLLLNQLTERLLQLKNEFKKLLRILRVIFVSCCIALLFLPWMGYANGLALSLYASAINLVVCFIGCIFLAFKQHRYTRLLTVVLASHLLAVIFSLLVFNGHDAFLPDMPKMLMGTFFISSMLISYLLIQQFIDRRDYKIHRQQQLLAEAKIKDNLQLETIKIQQDMEEDLERRIQEHTFELQVTLRELEDKNRELEEKNTLDALTGIRNRSYFDKKLTMEFRRSHREETPLAVIMLDIDHFKKINDSIGHLAGDDAIRFVANSIQYCLKRPSDEVCRYGGEEFAIILPNTDTEGAILVAQAIRQRINAQPVQTVAGVVNMTISAGVFSAIAQRHQEPSQYTAFADKALYQAKHQGRDQVCSFQHPLPNQSE